MIDRKVYEATQRRWQRRYAGRRWVMGVPVDPEPIGSMVDDLLELDIALRRVLHELRPTIRRLVRVVARLLTSDSQ